MNRRKAPPRLPPWVTPGATRESLDEFPEALKDKEVMPWEEPENPTRWQWGLDAGKRLLDIESRELVRKRKWLEAKQGMGTYFSRLIEEIDGILRDRMGE